MEQTPNPTDSQGGRGGGALQIARDMRLIERAVKRRWKMRDELFDVLPSEATVIALDRQRSDRIRLSAMKTLIAMHGQNEAGDKGTQQVNVQVNNFNGPTEVAFDGMSDADLERFISETASLADVGDAAGTAAPTTIEVAARVDPPSPNGQANGVSGKH